MQGLGKARSVSIGARHPGLHMAHIGERPCTSTCSAAERDACTLECETPES